MNRIEPEDVRELTQADKHVMLDFVVDKGQEPIRIDKFIIMRMMGGTRSKIQQAIDDECILVNGQPIKSNYRVRPEDHIIAYTYRDNFYADVIPEDIPLNIVYEDDQLMVINKPSNMVVHPGVGNFSGTVVNAAMFHFQKSQENVDQLPRVGLVHRIDKNTSGLLLLGKNEEAIHMLSKQFKAHTVQRKYIALVWGDVEAEEGVIDTYIARHERDRKIFAPYKEADQVGKHAITHYRVLERFNYVTLVECSLQTGRTHQIRVHMKHIGHTLFSDASYGGNRILKGTIFAKYKQFVENCFAILPRQALHAKTLGFIHPTSGEELFFDSEIPEDFQKVLDKWRTYAKAKNNFE
jgi:23S rRNA pseudouridine1911/1915/1917 synthase